MGDFDDPLIQKAAGSDFHLNEVLNGIPLNTVQHTSGGHALYNQKVKAKLLALWNAGGNTASPGLSKLLVRNLANNIRIWILAHPNQSINDIIL